MKFDVQVKCTAPVKKDAEPVGSMELSYDATPEAECENTTSTTSTTSTTTLP